MALEANSVGVGWTCAEWMIQGTAISGWAPKVSLTLHMSASLEARCKLVLPGASTSGAVGLPALIRCTYTVVKVTIMVAFPSQMFAVLPPDCRCLVLTDGVKSQYSC
jgi:hypothetical protein